VYGVVYELLNSSILPDEVLHLDDTFDISCVDKVNKMQFERQRQIRMSGSSLHQQVSHLYDAIYLNLLHFYLIHFRSALFYSRLYCRLLSFRQINAGTQN